MADQKVPKSRSDDKHSRQEPKEMRQKSNEVRRSNLIEQLIAQDKSVFIKATDLEVGIEYKILSIELNKGSFGEQYILQFEDETKLGLPKKFVKKIDINDFKYLIGEGLTMIYPGYETKNYKGKSYKDHLFEFK